MLLEEKVAVVYGAGSIGGAVARAFGAEGARVFVGNRTGAKAEALAAEIEAAGGSARGLEVDALDGASVRGFVDAVVGETGRIDVSFNLVSLGDVQGTPLVEMGWKDFMAPIEAAVRSNFLTVNAAVPHMTRGGVVLFFGGEGDPVPNYSIGGFQIALHAVEAMRRQYSSELGAAGVRFVTLRTGGVPESVDAEAAPELRDQLDEMLASATMTGRAATLADVGAVAAFVASDKARTMTAATVNVSAGALID